ncbi:MAG TPA: LPS assembly protein LptD [Acetobacteraceae bacterium]|nr:LPS assembly protein LptD [Acetobacteraceae bacterium]
MTRVRLACLLALLLLLPATAARAQLGGIVAPIGHNPAPTRNQPVTFSADQVQYDQTNNLVIATGHVEAWQNGHVLRADKIVFDRNTGIAAATGHVVLMEPDGEVMFADYAEMSQDMKDGVLKDMRALLAQNGKLAANGARRTGGEINELSRVVYSPCNLCKKDPTRPPLWQITAESGVQDLEHKRDEYYNATLQMFGWPVAWFPYISAPDPSVKRASGLLMPSFGSSSDLGAFFAQPYYLVLDDQSDATVIPVLTTHAGTELMLEYRRRFNNGYFLMNGTGGYFIDHPQNGVPPTTQDSLEGTIATKGQFDYNDTWRWGFDINRASSSDFVRDYHFGNGFNLDPNLLSSDIYGEGFGEGAYARVDTRFYEGVSNIIVDSELPVVLPRFQYAYFGQPDAWGGRFSLYTNDFNVMRVDGTNTQRAAVSMNWERPFTGALGDLWKLTLHVDAASYNASHFNQQPNFGTHDTIDNARALPQMAVDFRWPFMRDSGAWGTQIIEPHLQLVVGPQVGSSQNDKYPNEDSLDLEFTDTNLFGFNRFTGIDRLDGGVRLNAALQGTWYLGGTTFDGFIGQTYRTNQDSVFPEYTGLHDQVSDIVGHIYFAPTTWFDVMYRARFSHRTFNTEMTDVTASVGVPKFRLAGGFLYTAYDPYTLFDSAPPPTPTSDPSFFLPRDEVTVNASSNWGQYRFDAFARRDLTFNQMVAVGADAIYENECFILDIRFYRRYYSINGDSGSTALLFLLTFKTVGQFGYRAI